MNVRNRILGSLGAAALIATTSVAALATAPLSQADVDVKITQQDGATVSVLVVESSTNPFDDKTYSLDPQTSLGDLDVTVTDNRGTAKGWTIGFYGTDFVRNNTSVGANISAGNLGLQAGTVSKLPGSGANPGSVTVPLTMPTVSTQLWSASSNQGDGVFTLPLIGTLSIPAGTLVDTYKSTITVEVTAAPN